jgi:RNA polymerase sigma factor (TIGR02999 family)
VTPIPPSEVTLILDAIERGEQSAERLLPLVYEELRKLAGAKMANEAAGHTLQPTALVHEAWLRLIRGGVSKSGMDEDIFLPRLRRQFEGFWWSQVGAKSASSTAANCSAWMLMIWELPLPDDELLALAEALNGLAVVDERAALVVKLCFFVGLTQEQAAKELGVSLATAERLWSFARAWLFREMERTLNIEWEHTRRRQVLPAFKIG